MTDKRERRNYLFGSLDDFRSEDEEAPVERHDTGGFERAVGALTDAVQALVQRRERPAQPAPNITVKAPDVTVLPPEVVVNVNPEIKVQVPDTKVEVTFPDHEEIMVVERDDEGFISRIIKRFVRTSESESDPFAPRTIGQIVREGLGLNANKED